MKKITLFVTLYAALIFALPLHAEEAGNKLAGSNNDFAFDLYAKLAAKDGNIFVSPYSISAAMAMLFEGARGETAKEIASTMHFSSDVNERRAAWERSISELNKKNKFYELSVANALWTQKNYAFLKEFTDAVLKFYQGSARDVDYSKQSEACATINGWVESHTNGKIKNLVPCDALKDATRLVITNAVYFKGKWEKPFDKKFTLPEDFTASDSKKISVPMMSLTGEDARFRYAETDGTQAIELPYEGGELSMLLLLPTNGDLAALERKLDSKRLAQIKSSLLAQQVELYIPHFKLETSYPSLGGTLHELGINDAFVYPKADFSGMTGNNELYVSAILHKAYVEVNEEGTEAAAATAITMMAGAIAVRQKIPVFKADHPFLFFIQEEKSGAILFMGRLAHPNA